MKPVTSFLLSLVLLATLLASLAVNAGQITLSWDPNTESDLAGYRPYESTSGTNLTNFVKITDLGLVTQFTNTLAAGPHWYYLTAFNTSGLESSPSQIVYLYQPSVVQGMQIAYNKASKLIEITWTPNLAIEGVTNYAVYEDGSSPRLLARTSSSVYYLSPVVGLHTFFLRAESSTGGRSDPSSRVSYTGLNKPGNIRVFVP